MSVAEALARPGADRYPLPRIALALAAVAIVVAALALLMWLLAPAAAPPRPPARTPFGMGVREAAPVASGFGAYILALQGSLFRSLQAAVAALKVGIRDNGLVGVHGDVLKSISRAGGA